MKIKKWLSRTLAAASLIGVAIQFIPVVRLNPPVEANLGAPAEVQAILRAACYDCHSNETVWPWYAKVAPVSWLVASDVTEARGQFNFSTWQHYPPELQAGIRMRILREVRQGDMPPWYYALKHPQARLTPAQRLTLENWAAGAQ